MMLASNSEVATRLELLQADENRRFAEAWSWLDPSTRASSLPVAGGWCTYAGPDSPLTLAVGLGTQGEVTATHLDALEDFFFRRGAPARVAVSPLAHPSLVQGLACRGYVPLEFEHVVVRDLSAGQLGSSAPSSCVVRRVEPGDGERWAQVVARGFAEGEEPDRLGLLLARVSLLVEDMRCYLAGEGGEPVAGGAMVVRGDLAYLLGDATLPASRGRGAQSALIHHRVGEATGESCRLMAAAVVPGGGSHRNFERCGFLVAYTRITVGRNAPSGYTPAR